MDVRSIESPLAFDVLAESIGFFHPEVRLCVCTAIHLDFTARMQATSNRKWPESIAEVPTQSFIIQDRRMLMNATNREWMVCVGNNCGSHMRYSTNFCLHKNERHFDWLKFYENRKRIQSRLNSIWLASVCAYEIEEKWYRNVCRYMHEFDFPSEMRYARVLIYA